MWVAVQGCAHGELEAIYDAIEETNRRHRDEFGEEGIGLLICCGDFQSIRNAGADLESISCPRKYRQVGSFHKYYSGEKLAPLPTLFIGGNHEASSHLFEVRHGGWVAPNIYFLGHAGVVWFGGLRISGMSGIYKRFDFSMGRYEAPPFQGDAVRSVYHQRELDVLRLSLMEHDKLDVFLSHDWPRNITKFGDEASLLRKKKHFKDDVRTGQLGSPPCEELLHRLKPRYWFSAHLHCKFAAIVPHGPQSGATSGEKKEEKTTKFLALDKVLPGRHFLQFIDVKVDAKAAEEMGGGVARRHFSFDPKWLAVLKATHGLTVPVKRRVQLPPHSAVNVTDEDVQWVKDRLRAAYGEMNRHELSPKGHSGEDSPAPDADDVYLRIPQGLFVRTQEPHNAGSPPPPIPRERTGYPQMKALFDVLDVRDPFEESTDTSAAMPAGTNPDEIDLGDEEEEEEEE